MFKCSKATDCSNLEIERRINNNNNKKKKRTIKVLAYSLTEEQKTKQFDPNY